MPDPSRICRDCGCRKPDSEFRLRRTGGTARLNQCRSCHNQAERLRCAANRSKRDRKMLSKTLTALKNERSDRQVRLLCEEITATFGGPSGLVEAWHRCLAQDLPKGGFPAFRHIAAVIRLAQYCEQNRPDLSQLSEEELKAAADGAYIQRTK